MMTEKFVFAVWWVLTWETTLWECECPAMIEGGVALGLTIDQPEVA